MMRYEEPEAADIAAEASRSVGVRLTGETLRAVEQAAERKGLSPGQYLKEAGYAAATRHQRVRRRRPRRHARTRAQHRPQPEAAIIDVDAVATAVAGKLERYVAEWLPDQDAGYNWWADDRVNSIALVSMAALVGAATALAATPLANATSRIAALL